MGADHAPGQRSDAPLRGDAAAMLGGLLLAAGACAPAATVYASTPVSHLEGHVTIGPLRPAERPGGAPYPVPPAVYAARSIRVFAADGSTLVANVPIKPDGTYRAALAPGTYIVDIAHTGIDRARGLPKTITVGTSKTVRLDIHIDTGMR